MNYTKETYSEEFEAFWQAYPRRISKKAASVAFQRAMRDGVPIEKILAAVAGYRRWLSETGSWRPQPKHPTTWLNQGCWDDEFEDIKEEKPQVTFKLPVHVVEKLRAGGFEDQAIKRWFDEAQFNMLDRPEIYFKSEFMRDYVSNHFASKLEKSFGRMPELACMKAA